MPFTAHFHFCEYRDNTGDEGEGGHPHQSKETCLNRDVGYDLPKVFDHIRLCNPKSYSFLLAKIRVIRVKASEGFNFNVLVPVYVYI